MLSTLLEYIVLHYSYPYHNHIYRFLRYKQFVAQAMFIGLPTYNKKSFQFQVVTILQIKVYSISCYTSNTNQTIDWGQNIYWGISNKTITMADYLAYAYAIAVAAGGIAGYIKKGSLMSGIMVNIWYFFRFIWGTLTKYENTACLF